MIEESLQGKRQKKIQIGIWILEGSTTKDNCSSIGQLIVLHPFWFHSIPFRVCLDETII